LIGIDTNVLVRFLVRDDPDQARAASDFIGQLTEAEPGFVCREVLVELVWVLERAYRFGRVEIAQAIEGLLSATELVVEAANDVGSAIDLYRREGYGFADLMIASSVRRAGAKGLVTFDRKTGRLPNVRLLSD
jgi:predicted nucleic-acid-binding protein